MRKRITETVIVKSKKTVRVIEEYEQERGSRLLRFLLGNAKLEGIWTFSLPAGWTCPQAEQCLAKVKRTGGGIVDGPKTEFRCFSASQEVFYPTVRDARWHNLDLLKGKGKRQIIELILLSLPCDEGVFRLHVSGDFWSIVYLDAWLAIARLFPKILFYGYTKSLSLWISRREVMPTNFVLTASYGGREDALIGIHGLRSARVVYSRQEAADMGLEIDHDDSHAMRTTGEDFALLLHGMQPAGSLASKALSALRASGEYGYGEKADKRRLALHMMN